VDTMVIGDRLLELASGGGRWERDTREEPHAQDRSVRTSVR
jgi:hypothetical protein